MDLRLWMGVCLIAYEGEPRIVVTIQPNGPTLFSTVYTRLQKLKEIDLNM